MKPAVRNGFLLVFFAIFIWFFFCAGSFLSSPAQSPAQADIILALGGDNGDRIVRAAGLYKQGYAPCIMLTGLENSPAITRPSYLNWRAQFLLEKEVPFGMIILEQGAGNTWEEAVNTLALLKQRGWKRVIVVSDPPHMRRLHWVWSKVFSGSDKEFVLVSSEPAWWNPVRWWAHDQSGPFVLMEYIKLAYYVVAY
jgi:uncharacterized SAM-binding protein YcdF (DUF218 family)